MRLPDADVVALDVRVVVKLVVGEVERVVVWLDVALDAALAVAVVDLELVRVDVPVDEGLGVYDVERLVVAVKHRLRFRPRSPWLLASWLAWARRSGWNHHPSSLAMTTLTTAGTQHGSK